MAGVDYVTERGIDAACEAWLEAVAPYARASRPAGDPARSALVLLDLQRFFCDPGSHAHLPAVLPLADRLVALVAAFRAAGSPVLWTRHALAPGEDPGRMGDWWADVVREGSPAAAPWPVLSPAPGDPVLRKTRYDAFEGTALARRLDDAGATTVVLAGVMTHLCVETTARAAFARGLHVAVAADGTASADEALHVGALRALAHGFAQIRSCRALIGWRRAGAAAAGSHPPARATARALPRGPVDLAVIGAGPAGLAAAVQATRQGLAVALLEADRPGGLLHHADLVENYLGVGWIAGHELAARLVAQAARSGVRAVRAAVERIALQAGGRYRLELAAGPAVEARGVVVATGTRPADPGLPGAAEQGGTRWFRGVPELLASWSGEPGRAVVVGGGDIAFDGAVSLRRRGWDVTVLVRGTAPRALGLLSRRLDGLGVAVSLDSAVSRVVAAGDALRLEGARGGEPAAWHADRVLAAVGREPALPPIVDLRGGAGAAPCASPAEASTLPRLWLAGDVARGRDRQASIAAGDGVAAAMAAARELSDGP